MGRAARRRRPPPSGAVIFYGQVKQPAGSADKRDLNSLPDIPPVSLPSSPRTSVTDDKSTRSFDSLTWSASTAPSSYTDDFSPSSIVPSDPKSTIEGPIKSTETVLNGSSTVIAILVDVAELFSNVPYVKVAAGIALQILQIADQVRTNKERSFELIDKVISYSRVVFGALLQSQLRTSDDLIDLKEDLSQIGSVLDSIYAVLQTLRTPTTKARLGRIVNRDEVLERIGGLDRRLETSITAFQLKSSIVLRVNATRSPPTEVVNRVSGLPRAPSRRSYQMQSKPQIMFGRDDTIETIVGVILDHPPARLTILGPGGIGKTSVALSILHDDRVLAKYGEQRLFVSCEAAASADLIISELAFALRITIEGVSLGAVLQHLRESPCLLVLDNFETPWDPPHSRSEVEGLLAEVTALNTVAVLVTMRGSQRPAGVDWSRLLPPLRPVDPSSSMSIFQTISKKMDNFAVSLISAVDHVPLAVTLLANLAAVDGETPEDLWLRWSEESTSMVESGQGRLTSLEYSVRLSLSSPRMRRDAEALPFLSLLSLLPDGMSFETFRTCDKIVPGIPNLKRALSTLRQNALVFTDERNSIRVLSPIRLFVHAHYPPSPAARVFLQDHFLDLARQGCSHDHDSDVVRRRLSAEVGNIEAMLVDALRSGKRLERVVDATLSFSHHTYVSGIGSAAAVALAVERLGAVQSVIPVSAPASDPKRSRSSRFRQRLHFWKGTHNIPECSITSNTHLALKLRADCLGCWGQLLSRQFQFEEAKEKLNMAVELHIQAGDIAGQAYDLHNLGCLLSRDSRTSVEAESMFREATKLHEQIGDQTGKAYDLMGLGHTILPSDTDAAEEAFRKALVLYTDTGDELGRASALNGLGHTTLTCSQFHAAEAHFAGALTLNTMVGDVMGQAESLAGMACSFLLRSNFPQARTCIERSLALREPGCDADHLHIFGRLLIAEGKLDEAEAVLGRALALHEQIGDDIGKADDWQYLSHIWMHQGKLQMAIETLYDANNIYGSQNNLLGQADTFASLVLASILQLDLEDTRELLELAIDSHTQAKCLLGLANDYYLFGWLRLRELEFGDAAGLLERALELHCQTGNIQGQADDRNKLCEVHLRDGRIDQAMAGIGEALTLHVQIGDIAGQGDDHYVQASIFLALARFSEAEETIRQALDLHTRAEIAYSRARDLATLGSILWERSQDLELDRAQSLDVLEEAICLFDLSEAPREASLCRDFINGLLETERPTVGLNDGHVR